MYEDKIKELETNLSFTHGNQIVNYSDGYIGDVFSEIADSNIDIYVVDLFEWGKNNFEYINEATEEFGNPADIIKQIQQGQFLSFEKELYDNQNDVLLYYGYNYLKDNNIKLSENQLEDFEDYIDGLDNNDKLDDINSYCNSFNEELAI